MPARHTRHGPVCPSQVDNKLFPRLEMLQNRNTVTREDCRMTLTSVTFNDLELTTSMTFSDLDYTNNALLSAATVTSIITQTNHVVICCRMRSSLRAAGNVYNTPPVSNDRNRHHNRHVYLTDKRNRLMLPASGPQRPNCLNHPRLISIKLLIKLINCHMKLSLCRQDC